MDERGRVTWHVRSLALVREVLRRSGEVHQSGFASEVVRQGMPLKRWPVLWADGDEHRFQRTKVARYFAPKVVDARCRGLIEARADAFLARLDTGETVDMSELTLHFSAQVAAQVIGLTDSAQEAMARRLVGFFDQPAAVLEPGASGWRRLLSLPVRASNADPALGEDGLWLCPRRTLPRGVRAEVMSFGDGPHRCPGNTIAMIETEVLLERLLRRDVELVGEPRIEWEDLISGYAVRGLVLRQGVRS